MALPLSYSELLLLFTAAAGCVLLFFLFRRYWLSHPAGLQAVINRSDTREADTYAEYIVPLLVYEERYPAFGGLLSLVLAHFPLSRFLQEEEFKSALTFLRNSVSQPADRNRIVMAMSVVVRALIQDPDVEYRCRRQLPRLVNQFLREIGQ